MYQFYTISLLNHQLVLKTRLKTVDTRCEHDILSIHLVIIYSVFAAVQIVLLC